jgi:hypothetical protein
MSGVWDEQLHAMDYLAYAYLQGAQDKKALGVLDELNKIQNVEPQSFKVAYAAAAIPARYALERRKWSEAAKLELPREDKIASVASANALAGVSPTGNYWKS